MDNFTNKYRTIFISDIHLGTFGSKADILLDFLKHNDCEKLYLVGDVIDFWRLKTKVYWPQAHNDVIQKLLRRARKNGEGSVIYVLGNHDETFRAFLPTSFGSVEMVNEIIHKTADGKKLLVIHGDDFDGITHYAKWLAYAGDSAYTALLYLNRHYNSLRRKLGFGYWSLSKAIKHKVKQAVNFINDYELNMVNECKRRGLDGVVCGHVHNAEIKEIDGLMYYNDGDFCESITALVEDFDGNIFYIGLIEKAWRPIQVKCCHSNQILTGEPCIQLYLQQGFLI